MKPGEVIGEWVVVRTLGKGGMGTVFLCHHRDDENNLAALKIFPTWSTDEDGFKRFERECDVLSRLRHAGIVPLKRGAPARGRDAGSGVYWLAMEYVDGPSLESRLDHGALPPGYAAQVFHTLCEALEYAHAQGVFHRDIKPANIVLGSTGVRLVDFGIALQNQNTRLTAVGTFAGTLAYMPPEVVVDERVPPDPVLGDIYALGVVLFEALTAERAFSTERGLSDRERQMRILKAKMGTDALDVGPGLPGPLREVVRRATAPHPDDRIQNWSEFRRYLVGIPDEPDVVAQSEAPLLEDQAPRGPSPLSESGYRRRAARPGRGLRLGRRAMPPGTDPAATQADRVAPEQPPETPGRRNAEASWDDHDEEDDEDSGFTQLTAPTSPEVAVPRPWTLPLATGSVGGPPKGAEPDPRAPPVRLDPPPRSGALNRIPMGSVPPSGSTMIPTDELEEDESPTLAGARLPGGAELLTESRAPGAAPAGAAPGKLGPVIPPPPGRASQPMTPPAASQAPVSKAPPPPSALAASVATAGARARVEPPAGAATNRTVPYQAPPGAPPKAPPQRAPAQPPPRPPTEDDDDESGRPWLALLAFGGLGSIGLLLLFLLLVLKPFAMPISPTDPTGTPPTQGAAIVPTPGGDVPPEVVTASDDDAGWRDTGLGRPALPWPQGAVVSRIPTEDRPRPPGDDDAEKGRREKSTLKRLQFTVDGGGTADVYINGKRRGGTPLTLYLEPGEYKLQFKGPEAEVSQNIEVGSFGADEFRLEPRRKRIANLFQ